MTWPESLLVGAGVACLALFLCRTAAPFVRRKLERNADRAARDLRQEFLFLSRRQTTIALLVVGGLAAGAAAALTRSALWAALLLPIPLIVPGIAVRWIRTRRRKRIASQMPGFLDLLAGHVRAGHSLQEGLRDAVPLLPRGIREEADWLYRLVRLGTPLPEALLQWEKRLPCEEISLAARPLRLALPLGGNLVQLLERCRDVLRLRQRMEDKLRSMTAQARLQAAVLTLLPPGFLAALSRIDGDFFSRCLGTSLGRAILAASGFLQILGWITIRKILAVKP